MHRSRINGIQIDCQTDDIDVAARFWAEALGRPVLWDHPGTRENYRMLETPPGEYDVQIQRVDHESRVHLDIETDDIPAEVARLEKLGATMHDFSAGHAVKLTLFTDYSMRVLLYLGARPERLCSIAEVAQAYRVSQNHLMKVVNALAREGYVESVRGRGGGIRLGRPPEAINLGALVRATEDDFALVDCGACVVAPACGITGVLGEALAAFFAVLDRYTLADMLGRRQDLRALLLADAVA